MKASKSRMGAWAMLLALVGMTSALGAQGCSREEPDSITASPSQPSTTSSSASTSASRGAVGTSGPAGETGPVTGPRQRVVTVQTRIHVRSVPDAVRAIRREVAGLDGYVETAAQTLNGDRTAAMTLRVPPARLDALRAALARMGVVEHDEERVTDVTEQHADLDARLRNARAEEQRLLEILGARTGSLADVLAVERHLAETRGTIERLDAQMRVLRGQIAFAKLDVTLRDDPPRIAVAPIGPVERLTRAAAAGLETAWDVMVGAAVLGLRIGPTLSVFAAAVAGVVALVRMLRRRTRRRPATAA